MPAICLPYPMCFVKNHVLSYVHSKIFCLFRFSLLLIKRVITVIATMEVAKTQVWYSGMVGEGDGLMVVVGFIVGDSWGGDELVGDCIGGDAVELGWGVVAGLWVGEERVVSVAVGATLGVGFAIVGMEIGDEVGVDVAVGVGVGVGSVSMPEIPMLMLVPLIIRPMSWNPKAMLMWRKLLSDEFSTIHF